jgi:hypothetical protein
MDSEEAISILCGNVQKVENLKKKKIKNRIENSIIEYFF